MSNDTTVTLFSQSCLAQRDQPQSKLNSISSGLGVTLVRACIVFVTHFLIDWHRFQTTFFALNCAVSAFLFLIWRLADVSLRSHFWRRYGLFTFLVFLGSVGGAINAAAGIQIRYNFRGVNGHLETDCVAIDPMNPDIRVIIACLVAYITKVEFMSAGAYWSSVAFVPYGIEFLCLCCSKLLVRSSLSQQPSQQCPRLTR
jgi:hypothetical protein